MATIEENVDNLKLKASSEKRKEEVLLKKKQDGKVHQSGEDSTDSGPSNPPLLPDLFKEIGRLVPTQEDQTQKEETRDVEMKESEDSTDAVPSTRPTVMDSTDAVPSTRPTVVESTDAVPSTRPTAIVSAVQQSSPPLVEQPHKQEASTRTCPSSFAGPGPRFEDGERQAINVEEDKDLILLETAEKVAGVCGLRQVALRLRITESMVAQIEHDNPKLIPQFYQVFQLVSKRLPNSEEMFKQLLETMDKTNQGSTAIWLRKRLGMREPEASIGGEESSPISDVIPQTEETGRNSDNEFYDIFLMHTGRSDETKKFQNICRRRKWKVKTFDTISAASPPHMAIGSILNTSTHLALIITENDCIKYKNHEMCMTVEMALQLAYTQGTLAGKVLPIRCCQKRSLPLVLQALTGAHIDEDSFEERLVATIDTSTRLSRNEGETKLDLY